MDLINRKIKKRSSRAIKCLPFNSYFYEAIQKYGISAKHIFNEKEKYLADGFIWFNNADQVENSFCWLIAIGILRREVDGQGLTTKVRITPLGRQILEKNPQLPNQKATNIEKVKNWFVRKIII